MKDETYYLQHPSKQKFYRYVALFAGALALNSEVWDWFQRPKTKLYDIQRWLVLIFVPITVASQIFYLLISYNEHEFYTLATILSIIPIGFVVMVKSASAQRKAYKKSLKAFMVNIHLHNYKKPEFSEHKQKYITQVLIEAEKYTRWTFYFISSFVFICLCAWNTVPIIHNVQYNPSIHNITKRLEVCIHFWQPFDYEFNFYAYLFIQIIGSYCGGVAVIILVLFDTINFAFIYHIVGHIKIIKYNLRIDFQKKKMSDAEQKQKLIDFTTYYFFITDTFNELTNVFGLNVALIYAQNLVQGGLLLYQIMTTGKNWETIMTFGLLIPICMGTLLLISFILENVRIQADDIPALVYELPWQEMSVSNQKIVLIILLQVQPTLEFIAAFNIQTGMQPAINIIKTTFSYYIMIKSRKELK